MCVMYNSFMRKDPYQYHYSAFQKYLVNKKLGFREYVTLILSIFPEFAEGMLRYLPGTLGMLLRRAYYKIRLAKMGKNVLIGTGVHFIGPKNINIGNFTWIDSDVKLEAILGKISIGSRVHIASYVVIGARAAVTIEDFSAVASGAKIYANSEVPLPGLHMSGPMVPENFKGFKSRPIHLGKDSLVGTNSVLLPGANLGEGSIVGALSFLNKSIPAWEIWSGNPAKKVGTRPDMDFYFNET